MKHEDMIAVIQAHKDGKQLQYHIRANDDAEWRDCSRNDPAWDFFETVYRVKPEPPKPREFWLLPFGPTNRLRVYEAHQQLPSGDSDSPVYYPNQIHVREVLPDQP